MIEADRSSKDFERFRNKNFYGDLTIGFSTILGLSGLSGLMESTDVTQVWVSLGMVAVGIGLGREVNSRRKEYVAGLMEERDDLKHTIGEITNFINTNPDIDPETRKLYGNMFTYNKTELPVKPNIPASADRKRWIDFGKSVIRRIRR